MSRILVSIIIPTYNDWKRLSLCIEALTRQTIPQDMFEVIIVNNDTSDPTPDDMLLSRGYKIIAEETPGSYAARNAGLRIAKGEIIGFTDSDCIPDKDWIKNAVDYFENHRACSRIAGKISIFYESRKPTKAELYDKLFAFNQKNYVQHSGTGVTANLFVYKHVFDAIGFFNESLMSGGDFVWGTVAQKNGFKIDYVENVIINHPARKDLKELIKKERRVGGSQAMFLSSSRSVPANFLLFLKELLPHLKSAKFIVNVKELSLLDKICMYFIRHSLLSIRAYEKFRVQIGKKANRS